MPQLRQDPATKEWVIIATERSKRPDDFKRTKSISEKGPYKADCPFCPGNEHLTPPETLAYRDGVWHLYQCFLSRGNCSIPEGNMR